MKSIIGHRITKYWPCFFLFLLLSLRLPQLSLLTNLTNISVMKAATNGRSRRSFLFTSPLTADVQARALAKVEPTKAESWLQLGLMGQSRSLTYFELCRFYWQEGRMEEAVAACQSGHIPASYWINLGLAATQADQPEDVLAYYQMAVATDPTLPQAWGRLGGSLLRFERYAEGIAALEKALALNHPPDPLIYELLGRAYRQIGELDQSRSILHQGLERFPESAGLYAELAQIYGRENDWVTLEALYGQLTTYSPNNASAWAWRANAAMKLEQTHDAFIYYRQAVMLSPDTVSYQLGLAEAAVALEDWQTAVDTYNTILQLNPNNPQIQLQIGDFFRQINQTQRAMDIYNQILLSDPNNGEAKQRIEALQISP